MIIKNIPFVSVQNPAQTEPDARRLAYASEGNERRRMVGLVQGDNDRRAQK